MRHSRDVVWCNYDFLGLLNGRLETLQDCETLVSNVEPETLIAKNFEFEIMLQIKHHKISELKKPTIVLLYLVLLSCSIKFTRLWECTHEL